VYNQVGELFVSCFGPEAQAAMADAVTRSAEVGIVIVDC
jgi:hypothetical protein